MLVDDMGMGDSSAYQDFTGNADEAQLYTPQMERLARMGVRFTDAHTPASRCTPTRYSLLTGRYPWRSRLKWWVLFGAQGDPLIEADRPTIASMLRDHGYRTGMVGKWHLGLRYRQSDGSPAAGWEDADLAQPLHTSPLDHGFDFARFTSRSHGTSGPDAGGANAKKRNTPRQKIGPGHIHGRMAVSASGNGKLLASAGPDAYVLSRLGGRHSDHALDFLKRHLADEMDRQKPFFLYYSANSNHSPYTPDQSIGGKIVDGASRTVDSKPMDKRHDFIYENDVALGRMLDWLKTTDDPRRPGKKLIQNTLVIFTSDNGAEKNSDIATGPFRSNKGSCYEGGHRVPFLASWPAGGVGDGDENTAGLSHDSAIGLQDIYATLAEILGEELPNLREGKKGAEDSASILKALQGQPFQRPFPLFFSDHKEAKDDPAALAMRADNLWVDEEFFAGQWKIFFDAGLIRAGTATPYELYNLNQDPKETTNLIARASLQPLIQRLAETAIRHRNAGGHRLAKFFTKDRVLFDWTNATESPQYLAQNLQGKSNAAANFSIRIAKPPLAVKVTGVRGSEILRGNGFAWSPSGLGFLDNPLRRIEDNRGLLISFDQDVLVESVGIAIGKAGQCGGFYQMGNSAPMAVYCVDADNDSRSQHGILSDLGVLKAREFLRLDSAPHFGVEPAGQWRLCRLAVQLPNDGENPQKPAAEEKQDSINAQNDKIRQKPRNPKFNR